MDTGPVQFTTGYLSRYCQIHTHTKQNRIFFCPGFFHPDLGLIYTAEPKPKEMLLPKHLSHFFFFSQRETRGHDLFPSQEQ